MKKGTLALAVCGGRDYANKSFVFSSLDTLFGSTFPLPSVVLHGDCSGADKLARDWAESKGIVYVPMAAPWEEMRAIGESFVKRFAASSLIVDAFVKVGGILRNQMLVRALAGCNTEYKVLVAFPSTGTGTPDCIKRAQKANIDVLHMKEAA